MRHAVASGLLIKGGGHAMAAGVTIAPDKLAPFRAYLQELIDHFDGSYVLAIAGYNAGPDRVGSWLSLYGDPRDHGGHRSPG